MPIGVVTWMSLGQSQDIYSSLMGELYVDAVKKGMHSTIDC